MNNKNINYIGIEFCVLLAWLEILFIIFKLIGCIVWTWGWILIIPLWISWLVAMTLIIVLS